MTHYDYIVIGAGSAGCVNAIAIALQPLSLSRLSCETTFFGSDKSGIYLPHDILTFSSHFKRNIERRKFASGNHKKVISVFYQYSR